MDDGTFLINGSIILLVIIIIGFIIYLIIKIKTKHL
jgi:hypothetical protein